MRLEGSSWPVQLMSHVVSENDKRWCIVGKTDYMVTEIRKKKKVQEVPVNGKIWVSLDEVNHSLGWLFCWRELSPDGECGREIAIAPKASLQVEYATALILIFFLDSQYVCALVPIPPCPPHLPPGFMEVIAESAMLIAQPSALDRS